MDNTVFMSVESSLQQHVSVLWKSIQVVINRFQSHGDQCVPLLAIACCICLLSSVIMRSSCVYTPVRSNVSLSSNKRLRWSSALSLRAGAGPGVGLENGAGPNMLSCCFSLGDGRNRYDRPKQTMNQRLGAFSFNSINTKWGGNQSIYSHKYTHIH